LKGVFWKILERFGVQGIQFILQILLARILSPEHYGMLSMMIIFTTLANVFIQNGFNTALIQNKNVTEEDYSSVFWISMAIAGVLYGLIFLFAPAIAVFYEMPEIVSPLRVLALTLFPGALNSIQLAKVSRELDFKKVFYGNVLGMLTSGIASIVVAILGGGLWALVVQNLLNVTIACAVMLFSVNWYPRMVCNLHRVAELFRFGWKLLTASLLDTLETNAYSLIIGKKFDSGTLGFYNRGDQFPGFLINAINSTMQSVLLPAMSADQDEKEKVKSLAKNSILVTSYIIFPMMAGLACVGKPLIRLLLTEKWLPAVPYMQISCFCYAFYTIYVSNLQAINAVGRSDWFLKLEIIKKAYSIALLVAAVVFFDTPMAVAMVGAVTAGIDLYVNAFPNKKLIGYSFAEQLRDLVPMFIQTVLMLIVVLLAGKMCEHMGMADIGILLIQIITGVLIYLMLSAVVKPYPYRIILEMVFGKRKEK